MFYDLHIHTSLSIGENSVEEMAGMAKQLGLNGLGVARYYNGTRLEALPKIKDFDIVNAVILKPKDVEELDKLAKKVRNKAELLLVHGSDYDINRAACENSMIDILCHPELGRRDSGLDHICVKAAQENNVAIEINFREILESYKRYRVHILSNMKKNIKLCDKYDAPVVTNSGAITKWGLRSGRDLAAITNILGLELGKAIASVSTIPEDMIKVNREKLAEKRWEGVRIVGEKNE